MSEPPPPPKVSPDGKFYWDGQRWVPMQQAPTPEPVPAQRYREQQPQPPTPVSHRGRNVGIGCLSLIVLVFIIGILGRSQGGSNTPSSSSDTGSPAASAAPSAVGSQFITFGGGTLVVGKDVPAGTYRTRHDRQGCYIARLSGFGGSLDEIIANENSDGPVVVTILPTDKGFESNRCDTWTNDLSEITTSKTSLGEGDFIVGTDMEPGTYRNAGTSGCYWARLSGFGHTFDEIVANGNADAQAVVTIGASDKGFTSHRCGTWSKIA